MSDIALGAQCIFVFREHLRLKQMTEKLKQTVEEALKNLPIPSLSLRDLLKRVCPIQLARIHENAPTDYPEEHVWWDSERLMHMVEDKHLQTIRGYLEKALDGFVPREDPIKINQIFSERILGTVSQYPIYAYYTSEPVDSPPMDAILIGLVLAYKLGVDKAALVFLNRSDLKWSIWSVAAPDDTTAKEVLSDADYVEGIVLKKAPEEGISTTCISCPFQSTCNVETKFEPAPYTLGASTTRSFKLQDLLHDYLLKKNEEDDGRNTGFLSPSSLCISKCDRRMWYKRKKYKRQANIEPNLRRIFDMGHAVHDVIQTLVHEGSPEFRSEVTATLAPSIKGSCDGVEADEGMEIKSISNKGYHSVRGPKTPHHRQGSIYGAALNLKKVLYVYYNKSTGDVKTVYKAVDHKYVGSIVERAQNIEDKIEQGEIPERSAGYGCLTCPYKIPCNPDL